MIKNINIMHNQKMLIVHPGEILREDFLLPLNLTSEKLAQGIKVSPEIVKAIIEEKQDLDKDIATRLAIYFDMSTEFWLGIQHDYEQDCLTKLRTDLSKKITPLKNNRVVS